MQWSNYCPNQLATKISNVCRKRLLLVHSENFITLNFVNVSHKYFDEAVFAPVACWPGSICPSASILVTPLHRPSNRHCFLRSTLRSSSVEIMKIAVTFKSLEVRRCLKHLHFVRLFWQSDYGQRIKLVFWFVWAQKQEQQDCRGHSRSQY